MPCLKDGFGVVAAVVTALSVAFGAPAVGAAAAQEAPQMRFHVVRSNGPDCEPTCPEWISAEGQITQKTPALLKSALKELAGRKLPLVISSPGGDRDAAMALGRVIRKSELIVAVGLTRFVGCRPADENCKDNDGKGARYLGYVAPFGARCTEECALVLAGGRRRMAGQGAVLGRVDGSTLGKSAKRKLAAYLDEMGVKHGVMGEAYVADGQRELRQWDFMAMSLLTSSLGAELIVAADVCRQAPAPDNCRVFTTLDLEP
jgi:hypothetical protein